MTGAQDSLRPHARPQGRRGGARRNDQGRGVDEDRRAARKNRRRRLTGQAEAEDRPLGLPLGRVCRSICLVLWSLCAADTGNGEL